MVEKEELLDEVNEGITERKKLSENLDSLQIEIGTVKAKNELDMAKMVRVKNFTEAIPTSDSNNEDSFLAEFIGSALPAVVSGNEVIKQVREDLGSTIPQLNKNFEALTATTAVTNVAFDTASIYCESQKENLQFTNSIKAFGVSDPIERRDEIGKKLNELSPKLASMFNSAWQSLLDNTKERDIIFPAHAMREVISEFLQVLDPTYKVKEMSWCEFSQQRKVTQISRIKFAIFGDTEINEEDISFEPIKTLMNQERELYQKLSGFAHYRKEDLPENYQQILKNHMTMLQDILESILDRRSTS